MLLRDVFELKKVIKRAIIRLKEGGVPEWLKGPVSKTGIPAMVS